MYDPIPADPPPPIAVPPRGRWSSVVTTLIASTLGALIAFVALTALGILERAPTEAPTVPGATSTREIITIGGEGSSAAAVGEKVTPSIVTVEVGTETDGVFTAFGSGSGVVLSADGLIATNHHVIEDAAAVQVTFQDGRIYRAEFVGSDQLTDLAVLRIEAVGLVPIELGATGTLRIGDDAIAIGNPLGQQGGASLTAGVVSAFNREVQVANDQRLYGMIQTDAPITQGSSGGALVDGRGRLIGITTAIGISSAGAEGIGYAIPVELVTRITDELIASGAVRHAFLGVELRDSFGTDAGVQIPNGTVINGFVGEPSAAEGAGAEPGDVIIGFQGDVVRSLDDLVNTLRLYKVGDTVTLDIARDGSRLAIEVTLGERPAGL